MLKHHTKGLSVFVLVNLFAFVVHQFAFHPQTIVNLPLSYLSNALASLLICVLIFWIYKQNKNQIGFVFLGLSFFKMIVLYFVLSPKTSSEGVAIQDAIVIFIPFFINLVLEQLFMVKELKLGEVLGGLEKK
ncbi:DUF6168 family protein [Ochrovirga pacifica]|uniref:DUF6168 family protein n=1 Tax=Ochrovirga pacifica TaxID=1042376 RepID=UPI000255A57E|nr:DUF6168 family protein [Ochrovirga pacifica]